MDHFPQEPLAWMVQKRTERINRLTAEAAAAGDPILHPESCHRLRQDEREDLPCVDCTIRVGTRRAATLVRGWEGV
jgi:nicotinamidase-related amidase